MPVFRARAPQANCFIYEFYVLGGTSSYTVVFLCVIIITYHQNISWTLYLPWTIKLHFKGRLINNQGEGHQRTKPGTVNCIECPKQAKRLKTVTFQQKLPHMCWESGLLWESWWLCPNPALVRFQDKIKISHNNNKIKSSFHLFIKPQIPNIRVILMFSIIYF